MDFQYFLSQKVLGNLVSSYCWFAGIILLGILFKKVISKLLTRLLFKAFKRYSTEVTVNDFLYLLTKPTSTFVMLVTIYLAFDRLEFPQHWELLPKEQFGLRMAIFRLFETGIVISLTWIVLRIVDFFGLIFMHKATGGETTGNEMLVPFLKEALKIVIAVMSLFFMLGTIFHVNIVTLIGGLGIGGLAIALAAKESLENLLGSFTIFFDKPFVVGDLVHVGNVTGVVEKIGFRSTRLRTPEKSSVTMPNKKMVDAELDNLTMRSQRRASFDIELSYKTTAEQLKSIVEQLKKHLDTHPKLDKVENRVHFLSYGKSSLNINILYFVDTSSPDVFMEVKEEINFKIMQIVQQNEVQFAFPIASVFVEERKIS
jgi:MscS family membrane protein